MAIAELLRDDAGGDARRARRQRHYQKSAAVAGGAGFAPILIVATLVGN